MSTGSEITVSIITPCYNGERYIAETLRSAIGQTRPPLEVIVIDDGSTDRSAEIAERFGPPVRVMRQSNKGESVARNRGLAEARGSHVLFLDADDLLADESLARLCAAIEGRSGAVALMGCRHFRSETGEEIKTDRAVQTRFYPEIIGTNFGPPLCWLVPLEIVRKAGGFYEPLQWFEDWDLWWRVGLYATEIVPVDYVGALYRQHAKSQFATVSMTNRTRGHAIITARMANELLNRPELLRVCGEPLLWAVWTALVRAREHDAPAAEWEPLLHCLGQLARQGPAGVKDTKLARSVRMLGPRGVLALNKLRSLAHGHSAAGSA